MIISTETVKRVTSQSQSKVLTISVAIVRSHFLSNSYMFEDSKCYVPSFTKQFNIVIAIMLCTTIQGRGGLAQRPEGDGA